MAVSASKQAVVLDVGTTNIKVFVFDSDLSVTFSSQQQIITDSPKVGWAEQNPLEVLNICRTLLAQVAPHCGPATKLGITNQRESVVAWDRATGKSISPLILWSDKRTQSYCDDIRSPELEQCIRNKTGLLLDPYSSASKFHWLMQQTAVMQCHDLALGTLDSWLAYKLTNNFLTDFTNASRTMLYNIQTREWDDDLLNLFGVPRRALAEVRPSKSDFGNLQLSSKITLPLTVMIGDQQASLYAAGTAVDTTKVTYGTGIFPMKLIGSNFRLVDNYLTTLAIGPSSEPTFALEGKVDNAAPRVSAVIDRDQPAFDKLMLQLAHEAAPVISGLVSKKGREVFVDGGISQNDDILREQAKINHIRITRLSDHNGTALGVAKLLMHSYNSLKHLAVRWPKYFPPGAPT